MSNYIGTLRFTLVACCAAVLGGCASLPDTEFWTQRYASQAARFESVRGPLSTRQSAAVMAEIKRKAGGDLDILDRHITLEQEITGSPLVLGNRVRLLQDGPATYKAMFSAIRAARDNVNVQSYIIEDDEVGNEFADLLVEVQGRGVQVNLIYDSIGALGTPRSYFDRLAAAGVSILEFNPISPLAARGKWNLDHRDHRKLTVVDGRTAFLGGINISSVYSTGSASIGRGGVTDPKKGWRDTDVQIDGPAVAEFQKLFMQTWEKQKGPALVPRDYFPTVAAQGSEIVRAIGSSPDDPFSFTYLTFISAITHAEKQAYFANAYFVPDPQLVKALLDAVKRGVDVRLILPSISDSSLVFHAGRSFYTELLAGGVRIFERGGAVLHVKSAVIDGVWSTVGSTNLDWRSAMDNDELNAVVLGREFATQMLAAFNRDLAASEEIKLESWAKRPVMMRFKEAFARIFGRLL